MPSSRWEYLREIEPYLQARDRGPPAGQQFACISAPTGGTLSPGGLCPQHERAATHTAYLACSAAAVPAAARAHARPGRCPAKTRAAPPTPNAVRSSDPQVVFVTTEVAPWSQVGGLGDVMAALPAALAARWAFCAGAARAGRWRRR